MSLVVLGVLTTCTNILDADKMIVPIFSDINISWAWWGVPFEGFWSIQSKELAMGDIQSPINPLSFLGVHKLFIYLHENQLFFLSTSARLTWNAEAFETASTILIANH